MRRLLFAVAVAMTPIPAWADHNHAHDELTGHNTAAQMLAASTPTDGAVLAQAPRTLALTFAHPVLLRTVAVTGPDGSPINATFRRSNTPAATYSVALPTLASGAYEARWTATGSGHSMDGIIRFTVQ